MVYEARYCLVVVRVPQVPPLIGFNPPPLVVAGLVRSRGVSRRMFLSLGQSQASPLGGAHREVAEIPVESGGTRVCADPASLTGVLAE